MKLSLRVILVCAFAPPSVLSRLSLVQTYFVPLPEADLLNSFQLINNEVDKGARSPVTTIISIAIAADGTKIVYDQWEDGYESDAANPTQSTTQIWGDGKLSNGAAPGVLSDAGDVLQGGQAIILQNDVPIPRDIQALFFDGKDRVSATLPIAITRSAYPGNAGSLMAGAVEVFNTEVWGVDYVAPVGQNTVSVTSAFEMSAFHVMASKSGTTVTYPSTPGGASITTTIDVGDNLIFQVNEGDVVTSDYPVQVSLITGDVASNYEMRWYAMIPREKWSSEYISPVAETFGNTAFWFRNPNEQTITIQFFGGNIDNNGQTFTIPPHSTVSQSSDTNGAIDISGSGFDNALQTSAYRADYTGLKFICLDGKPFFALVQVDADEKYIWVGNGINGYGYINGQGWDWGFPLIPSYDLSSQALVGLGYSCKDPKDCDRHRSYVWVTPVSDAYIFVDFDGDKNFDRSFTLGMLKALLIQDDADFDMSGAMIAAFSARNGGADNDPLNVGVASGNPVDIAVAWGQNPSSTQIIASSQNRELDLGTVIVPLPNPWVSKQVLKILNPDGTEDPRFVVDQAGDVIVYEISVSNVGFGNFYGLTVSDPMITSVGGSLNVLSGPVESKTTNGILEVGEKFTWTGSYQVTTTDMALPTIGVNAITNFATADGSNFDPVEVKAPVDIKVAIISGTVTEDIGNDRSTLNDVPLSNVLITLTDKNGLTIRTTITNSNGFYEFQNVEAGDYFVIEQNPTPYYDVNDQDGGPDLSKISVFGVLGGDEQRNKDFVDELLFIISGNVREDTNNDDVGDDNLSNVVITLRDESLNVIKTTVTDTSGNYKFDSLVPGKYFVTETNLSGYTDVSDIDSGDLNKIAVNLVSTDSVDNNFIDERLGKITGIVTNNAIVKVALAGAVITLKNDKGTVLATTVTTASGQYSFVDLPVGSYTVEETNPTDYPDDVSAYDVTDDKDPTDLIPSVTKNVIPVALSPGEVDDGNNFIDTLYLTISGNVMEDTNNDDTGDVSIANVLISLLDENNDVLRTTVTDSSGNYKFVELEAGKYFVSETNLNGFSDVKDLDGGDLNKITVTLLSTNSEGNDFVDERPSDSPSYQPSADPSSKPSTSPSRVPSSRPSANPSESPSKVILLAISGNVREDTNNDDVGDVNLSNVVITLRDESLNVIKTTVTDTSGNYKFDSLVPGKYFVTETNLSGYTDVSDIDSGDLNKIAVNLVSTDSVDNNFIDERLGKITGIVTNNAIVKVALAGAVITLKNDKGTVLATTVTTASGQYSFVDLPVGSYTVEETNPTDYPDDVSAYDVTDDKDPTDLIPSVTKNVIPVALSPGEVDDGNNFIDTLYLTISGNVMEDTNNDDTGDVSIANVLISLLDENNDVLRTTVTDSSGNYKFVELEAGKYFVSETNLNGFSDVKDLDGGDLNKITVTLLSTNSEGNDFVDERPSDSPSTAPSVTASNKPSVVRSAIPSASPSATPSKAPSTSPSAKPSVLSSSTPTNAPSDTSSNKPSAARSAIPSSRPSATPSKVASDSPTEGPSITSSLTPTSAASENPSAVRSAIPSPSPSTKPSKVASNSPSEGPSITSSSTPTSAPSADPSSKPSTSPSRVPSSRPSANPSESPSKVILLAISGNVREDTNNDDVGDVNLTNVVITLRDENLNLIRTTVTDSSGTYKFVDVEPGTYFVTETNLEGFTDVWDSDQGANLNQISVIITTADSLNNNFVDERGLLGQITGIVTNKNDAPLVGAVITLTDDKGAVVATTSTSTTGEYAFRDVPPGDYTVVETNPVGYPGDVSAYDVTDDKDPTDLIPSVSKNVINVTVTAGELDDGNKFVDTAYFVISGNVKEDTNNDDTGDVNLASVLIALLDANKDVLRTTVTDSSGNYKFVDVEPGTYFVTETNLEGFTDVWDSDQGANLNQISVIITTADSLNNNFVDERGLLGQITGIVTNKNDAPLVGAVITLTDDKGAVVATTSTSTTGEYAFRDVPPGDYTVVETNPVGYPVDVSAYDVTDDKDPTDLIPSVSKNVINVTVTAGELDDGNKFVDTAYFVISGNVKEDTNNDDTGDVNLASVLIALLDANKDVLRTTVTDSSGNYKFVDVEPGTYFVTETNLEGFTDVWDSDQGANLNQISVIITTADSLNNNFVDERGLLGQITGIVTNKNDAPLVGAVITLTDDKGAVVATTSTSTTGEYAFRDVPPGDYTVVETNPVGYPVDVSAYDVTDDKDPTDLIPSVTKNVINVTVTAGELDDGNKFVDTAYFVISGNVKEDTNNDDTGDVNLASVLIALLDANKDVLRTTVTDSSGNYKFVDVEPGTYFVTETNLEGFTDVWDSDQGANLNQISVIITTADSLNNNFVDERGLLGQITGIVTNKNDAPLVGAVITLTDDKGAVVATTSTSTTGEYAFRDVPPGDYTVVETNPVGYPVDVSAYDVTDDKDPTDLIPSVSKNVINVTVTAGELDDGNKFVDTAYFVISGNVKEDTNNDDTGDVNLASVLIALLDANKDVLRTTVTDSSGNYKFVDVEPGTYFVTETNLEGFTDVWDSDQGANLNQISVIITTADSLNNNFVDERGLLGQITGIVTNKNDAPLVGAVITLTDDKGAVVATTSTSTIGEYAFRDVPPGDYTVVETNPVGYPVDVSAYDVTDDKDPTDLIPSVSKNVINVTVTAGELDDGNKFVDTAYFVISGNVKEDTNNDDTGDVNLASVLIALLDANKDVLRTTVTDSSGNYKFVDVEPGTYFVTETNLEGFTDVWDSDQGANLNQISVIITTADSLNNNFVDERGLLGQITGIVTNKNDAPLVGAVITLTDDKGAVVATTSTSTTGEYAFRDVPPGDYTVVETNPVGYPVDVSAYDVTDDKDPTDLIPSVSKNVINVTVTAGELDDGNKFVDTAYFVISGNVKEDTNNDDTGDVNLASVLIALLDANKDVLRTTVTDSSGNYKFVDVEPGTYFVTETNLEGFTDVWDSDQGANLNQISVIITTADSLNNNFVDERGLLGQITGIVTNKNDAPLVGAVITLTDDKGAVVATTSTSTTGEYAFRDVPPGDYTVVETNPVGYPVDVSAYDVTDDKDPTDLIPSVTKNVINVTVTAGELDDGNKFVDAVINLASDFCEELSFPGCSLCAPFRSIEFRSNPSRLESNGYWFQYLEDKIAGYLFSVDQQAPSPEIFCCETDVAELSQCLKDKVFTRDLDGIVIKATNFHSSQGVFVLVNETGTGDRTDPLFDLIKKLPTTYADAMTELSQMQATKIIVEEFVGKTLPTEYKFHVVNGSIAAIDIVEGRDGDCPCYAVVDIEWNRLDAFGCFEPGGVGHVDDATSCTAIDVETGKRKAGAIKKDLYTCKEVPAIDQCLFNEMIGIALDLGNRIGVYTRVDMFVAGNKIWVQEYSANHMNGLRHCAAKKDENGCIDSCFLGRMWNDAGAEFGGIPTAVPDKLVGFTALTPAEQCSLITNVAAPKYASKCA